MTPEQATKPTPMVAMRQVTKRYGQTTVLERLDLSVQPAEKVALIGPSGSGKSTLLRVLMTLEDIDAGQIHIDGEALVVMPDQPGQARATTAAQRRRAYAQIRAKVGMVFQSFNLFPHMTALQNVVEAQVQVLKMTKTEAQERARALLDQVGLHDKTGHYPANLSGGQQQRVAIARALAMRPKVLLLDEITSALDPELCGEVLNVVRELGDAHKLTMLMVTHQMGFARDFADRVCFLYQGAIHEEGTPDEIFDHPQEARTQAFLRAVRQAG